MEKGKGFNSRRVLIMEENQPGVIEQPARMSERGVGVWLILSRLKKILLIINVGLLGLILTRIFFVAPKRLGSVPQSSVKSVGMSALEQEQAVSQSPFEIYETVVAQRDFFKLPYAQTRRPAVRKESKKPVVKSVEGAIEGFKVVGIVVDQDPKVIFEEIKTKETIFLSVGEELQGAVFEEILEGKAIFMDKGQRLELSVE